MGQLGATLELTPPPYADTVGVAHDEGYQFVDQIPELAKARAEIRQRSSDLLECRRLEKQMYGHTERQPIDALSTARAYLAATSPAERKERYEGLLLDCQRLYAEWYRKNESEFFAPLEHTYDAATGDFYSHGFSTGQMTENALLPIEGLPEEETRRIHENVEERTPLIARQLGFLAANQCVRTISQCPQWAINRLESNVKSGAKEENYLGYVPQKNKGMIRDLYIDAITGNRFEVQMGLSGEYYTPEIFEIALSRMGLDASGMSRTDLQGAQFIAGDSQKQFLMFLDEVASEQWCVPVFAGKQVEPGTVKDYDKLYQEAYERQSNHGVEAAMIADYVVSLAESGVDGAVAPKMVDDYVKDILLEAAKRNIEIAEVIFDKDTANGLMDVAYLEAIGQYEAALARMEEVRQLAPGGGACGGGGCGIGELEGSNMSREELLKNLRANPGDKKGTDKDRSCKCGGKLHYAWSLKHYNTFCEGCNAFTSVQTSVTKSEVALAG